MIESKAWDWEVAKEKNKDVIWRTPCIESYYLINRWKSQDKKKFLDLGCGLGRHTIQFAKEGFETYAFDLSEVAIEEVKKEAKKHSLKVQFELGDMINIPYEAEMFDFVMCRNVISHTDTEGMKKIVKNIYKILKPGGECYLTLGSKDANGFKREDWPKIDANTRIKIEDGPENGIPHFYADYELIKELFGVFKIIITYQTEEFYEVYGKTENYKHYNLLIKK